MKFTDLTSFSLKITFAKKGRAFLVILGIFLGTLFLSLFASFSNGFQAAVNHVFGYIQGDVLTVIRDLRSDENGLLNFNFSNKKDKTSGQALDEKLRQELLAWPEIKNVSRDFLLTFPNSATVPIFGFKFSTDMLIRGTDIEVFKKEIPDIKELVKQKEQENIIPVVISPIILDIYNNGLAETLPGLRKLDPESIIGRKMQIHFGKSTFLPLSFGGKEITKEAEIVGVSMKANPIGINIPLNNAMDMLQAAGEVEGEEIEYSFLFIQAEDASKVKELEARLKAKGLIVKADKDKLESIAFFRQMIKMVLLVSGSVAIFIALLFLISVISISILEHTRTIGILRSIGASNATIRGIFLTQGLILAGLGAIPGVLTATLSNNYINGKLTPFLSQSLSLPDQFLILNFGQILILLIVIFIAVIISSLIASFDAIRIDVVKALFR